MIKDKNFDYFREYFSLFFNGKDITDVMIF